MPERRSIKVGIPVSLTGQFRTQGEQALAGLQAWAADANLAGGILLDRLGASLPVTVVHYDDASSPAQARDATERLIAIDHVDILMGPYSGVLVRAAAGVDPRQSDGLGYVHECGRRAWRRHLRIGLRIAARQHPHCHCRRWDVASEMPVSVQESKPAPREPARGPGPRPASAADIDAPRLGVPAALPPVRHGSWHRGDRAPARGLG